MPAVSPYRWNSEDFENPREPRASGERLVPAIRTRLERSYCSDLTDVRVHIGPEPDRIGASAFAFGHQVFISPEVWDSSPELRFHAIAHECAHVVQQRQGSVRRVSRRNGIPFCLDPSLEAEAEAAATLAARGESAPLKQDSTTHRQFQAAVQPLISVNGQLVKFAIKSFVENKRTISTNLSEKFVRLLRLVPGSVDWLDWAANKTSRAYAADSELILLLELIEGLHNTPLLRLPAIPLTIHAARLWELSTDDFFALTEQVKGGAQKNSADQVIAAHGFQKQDILNSTLEYFQNLTGTAAHWADVTLGDQIALQNLFVAINPDSLPRTTLSGMAAFAVEKAQQVGEFADCCQFYLAAAPSTASEKKTAAPQVWELWDDVIKFAVRYLNSPSFGVNWHKSHLHSLVRNWIETGGQIGFPTVSSAAFNILKHSSWMKRSSKTNALEDLVAKYVTKAQALIYSGHGASQGLSQDGETRRFLYQTGGQRAILAVDSYGTATIESFAE